jgi:hypothetical protein
MKNIFQRDNGCLHCKYNPEGIEPFIKIPYKNKDLSQETKNMIEKLAKKENRPKECILCSIMLFYWTKKVSY